MNHKATKLYSSICQKEEQKNQNNARCPDAHKYGINSLVQDIFLDFRR